MYIIKIFLMKTNWLIENKMSLFYFMRNISKYCTNIVACFEIYENFYSEELKTQHFGMSL